QAQFRHELLVGDAAALTASVGRALNVGLILQGLQCPVEELRRDDNGATTAATAEDLHRRPLCGVEHLALMGAEVTERRGHHDPNSTSCTTRGLVVRRCRAQWDRLVSPDPHT